MMRRIRAGLKHIDHGIVPLAFDGHLEDLAKETEATLPIPLERAQGHHRSLASDYQDVAAYKYAFQYSSAEIRDAIANAGRAWTEVFKLRGTSPSPIDLMSTSPAFEDAHEKDYSRTNPKSALLGLFDAIIAGDDSLCHQIAELLGHPRDADYVDPRSDDCTPNHLHLALALKGFLLGDSAAAESEIKKVRLARHIPHVWHLAQMLLATIKNDTSTFIDGLEHVLAWHRKQALKDYNLALPEFFLCIPALALCRLALQRGVCNVDDLPQDNVFLPLDLITDPKTPSQNQIKT